jgi:hypothetical protein
VIKKAKQRWRIGDVAKIGLGDGEWAFGRVLKKPLMAFYNLKAVEPPPIETIVAAPVAFKVWVMNYAISDGDWSIIGNLPLTPDLEEQPTFFKKDPISHRLSIYFGGGVERPASLGEVEGLECAAVWEPEHVADRLRDLFAGRPNKWVDSMRPD